MAVSASDLQWRLSGGASNADASLAFGGAMSSHQVDPATLFPTLTEADCIAGGTDYRILYAYNAGSDAMPAPRAFLPWNTFSSATTVAVAMGHAGVNADEVALPNSATAPSPPLPFTTAADDMAGASLPDLPAGGRVSVVLRRSWLPSAPTSADAAGLGLAFDAEVPGSGSATTVLFDDFTGSGSAIGHTPDTNMLGDGGEWSGGGDLSGGLVTGSLQLFPDAGQGAIGTPVRVEFRWRSGSSPSSAYHNHYPIGINLGCASVWLSSNSGAVTMAFNSGYAIDPEWGFSYYTATTSRTVTFDADEDYDGVIEISATSQSLSFLGEEITHTASNDIDALAVQPIYINCDYGSGPGSSAPLGGGLDSLQVESIGAPDVVRVSTTPLAVVWEVLGAPFVAILQRTWFRKRRTRLFY